MDMLVTTTLDTFGPCYACGIEWAAPAYFVLQRRQDGKDFWCPNGHRQQYTESAVDRLTRERDRLAQRIAERDDEIVDLKKRVSAERGQVTRLRNRAKAGLCPCCNRHFTNLERHVATKHPGFKSEGEAA